MPTRPEVLRNRVLYWTSWLAAAASVALFFASVLVQPDQALGSHLALALLVAGAAALFVRATRLRLELTGTGVTVHKFLSTDTVPWSDVEDVTADRYGLHIRLDDGAVVSAGTMGTSPWASWFNTDANGKWVHRLQAWVESSRTLP